MVNKFITDFDILKVSGPDCIPMVVLINFEPDFVYILVDPFCMCLKESCFSSC